MMMSMWSEVCGVREKNKTKQNSFALLTSLRHVKCFTVQSCKTAGKTGSQMYFFRCAYEHAQVPSCVEHTHKNTHTYTCKCCPTKMKCKNINLVVLYDQFPLQVCRCGDLYHRMGWLGWFTVCFVVALTLLQQWAGQLQLCWQQSHTSYRWWRKQETWATTSSAPHQTIPLLSTSVSPHTHSHTLSLSYYRLYKRLTLSFSAIRYYHSACWTHVLIFELTC